MNYNKAFLAFLVFLVLFPISYALADTKFKFEDRMNDGGTLFFLVELEEDDEIEVELEAREEGYFHLYLFDERPTESHVNYDNTMIAILIRTKSLMIRVNIPILIILPKMIKSIIFKSF